MVDVASLFSDLEQRYGLPSGYLGRTYQIESGGGRNLYNRMSGAAGPFQFIPSTAQAYGLKDPYDIQQSADAAARLAAANRADLQRAGIQSPSAEQLYLAHQQGAGGAAKLLRGAEVPAGQLVGRRAVEWNAGNPDMTGSEFAQQIMNKFAGVKPAFSAPTGERPAEGQATSTAQAVADTAQKASSGAPKSELEQYKEDQFFKGLASSGLAMMQAGMAKPNAPMRAAVGNRPKYREDIFAGLLG